MSGKPNLPETYSEAFHGRFETHPFLKNLEYRKLGNTTLRVSQIGYGTGFPIYGNPFDRAESVAAIQEGLKSGINFIDTSPWYGDSEDIVGEALKSVPRNVYYIATKCGRNYAPEWKDRFDFSRAGVLKSVDRSLSRLGLDYVDIIHVHDVEFAQDVDQIVNETLPALEEVVRAGKAKYIGITAYDLNVLKYIAERARVDVILTYCRFNLNDTTLEDYLPFFKKNDIGIINASPVAMGLFTAAGYPAWHPASPETKALAAKANALAQERGQTIDSLACAFSMRSSEEAVATTLVGMPTKRILRDNMESMTRPLTKEGIELAQEIRSEVFGNKHYHWEGVEVAAYKKALLEQ